jgi:hypothetical protein
MITPMLHDSKGLLALFSFSSEMKDIGLLFAVAKRNWILHAKSKIHENKRVLHAAIEYLPAACYRVTDWMSLETIAKGNQMTNGYPLEQIACGIRELHATPIIFAFYRWENFKF